MIEKLQAHYGFTRMPFGRDLAPGMLHRHAAHNEACARITWCIAERAIGVITGEVGAGKTVSVRTVLAGLDASRHTIIYLPNPMIGIRGLHEMIVATFGGQPDRSYSRLTAQASAMLAAERDERGKTPVLVIDEAHLLRYEQLETIRMLTNHNLDADSPLACLLIGQPTLRRTMKLAVLAALEQRTALRYAMPPMTSQETSSYISHHLKLAGRSDPLFSDDAACPDPHHLPRLPPRGEQPGHPGARRHLRRRQSHRRRASRPLRHHRSHRHLTGTSPTTTGTTTTKAPQPHRLRGFLASQPRHRERLLRRHLQRRATLNAAGLTTGHGRPFDVKAVQWIRHAYHIPAPAPYAPGEISTAEAARQLGCSTSVIYHWIHTGQVTARRGQSGRLCIPWNDQVSARCQELVTQSARLGRTACPRTLPAPPSPAADGEVSVTEAAYQLGCSIHVIYYWIDTGKLAARRSQGGRLCIPWNNQVQAECRARIELSGHLNPAARKTKPRRRH